MAALRRLLSGYHSEGTDIARTAAQSAAGRAAERAVRAQWTAGQNTPVGRPFVPAVIIAELLEPLIVELGVGRVGRMSSLGHRGIYEIRMGLREYVRFDTADRVICQILGHPELWWEDPRLRVIYEAKP